MTTVTARHIKWGSTQVEDGTVIVELTGPHSKIWGARFQSVLVLLDTPHSGWGEVRLTKKGIRIDELQAGAEEQLHHLLESVVMQVNVDTDAEEHETDAEAKDEPDSDAQMAATFRGFAAASG
ncbi:MAG: hypothetical protein ACRDK2_13435 [Solirubrobacteraceae bacterium]